MTAMRALISFLAVVGCALAACSDDPADDAGAAGLDCATYCTGITANCPGVDAQYGGTDAADATAHCMATCDKFPKGAASDRSGNTLGCRIYHSDNAKSTGQPGIHCVHAGPAGAQAAVAAPGICSDACTNFCSLEIAACGLSGAAATGQYASTAACMTACGNFDKTAYVVDTRAFPSKNPAGDNLACRLYHTTNALISADSAKIHCPHTAEVTTMLNPCFTAPAR
jgi:hypothetical protein